MAGYRWSPALTPNYAWRRSHVRVDLGTTLGGSL
jgi:hypothetical protein